MHAMPSVDRGYRCFVLEGTMTITNESGHIEISTPVDSRAIPRGFNSSFKMTGNFGNCFMSVEPER